VQVAAARYLLLTADSRYEAQTPSPKALLARTGGKVSIAAYGSRQDLGPSDQSLYTRRTTVIADSLGTSGLEAAVHTRHREFPDRSPPQREDGTSFTTVDGTNVVTCRWTYDAGTSCTWNPQSEIDLLLGFGEPRFLDGGVNIPVSVHAREHDGDPARLFYVLVRMEPDGGTWVVRSVRETFIYP
jgi:hypothetical protein